MSARAWQPNISNRRIAVTLATAGFVGGVLFGPSLATAAQKVGEVFISNTASDPVPVRQQGTADVNVTNTVPVQQQGPVFERDAGTPLVLELRTSGPQFYEVPAGKRFVVKYLHATWLGAPDGVSAPIDLTYVSPIGGIHFEFLGNRESVSTGINYYVSETLSLDAGPGDILRLNAVTTDFISMRLTGYLVDA